MKNIFILLSFALSSVSFSAVNGTWNGNVNYATTDGYSDTSQAEISINQNSGVMTYHQSLPEFSWDYSLEFDIINEDLVYKGKVVGKVTDAMVKLEPLHDDTEEFTYAFEAKIDADGAMTFVDATLYDNENGYGDSVSGVLDPAKN